MRYFIVIVLALCVFGGTFVLADQKPVNLGNFSVSNGSTIALNNPGIASSVQKRQPVAQTGNWIGFLLSLPMATVEYLMPIETVLSNVPVIGAFFQKLLLIQFAIFVISLEKFLLMLPGV